MRLGLSTIFVRADLGHCTKPAKSPDVLQSRNAPRRRDHPPRISAKPSRIVGKAA